MQLFDDVIDSDAHENEATAGVLHLRRRERFQKAFAVDERRCCNWSMLEWRSGFRPSPLYTRVHQSPTHPRPRAAPPSPSHPAYTFVLASCKRVNPKVLWLGTKAYKLAPPADPYAVCPTRPTRAICPHTDLSKCPGTADPYAMLCVLTGTHAPCALWSALIPFVTPRLPRPHFPPPSVGRARRLIAAAKFQPLFQSRYLIAVAVSGRYRYCGRYSGRYERYLLSAPHAWYGFVNVRARMQVSARTHANEDATGQTRSLPFHPDDFHAYIVGSRFLGWLPLSNPTAATVAGQDDVPRAEGDKFLLAEGIRAGFFNLSLNLLFFFNAAPSFFFLTLLPRHRPATPAAAREGLAGGPRRRGPPARPSRARGSFHDPYPAMVAGLAGGPRRRGPPARPSRARGSFHDPYPAMVAVAPATTWPNRPPPPPGPAAPPPPASPPPRPPPPPGRPAAPKLPSRSGNGGSRRSPNPQHEPPNPKPPPDLTGSRSSKTEEEEER
nr:unnamed protein product [Digitaria exilis]